MLQMGRFWTMDTFEGDQEDPQSLQKYIYTRNQPVNRIDPSGNQDMTMDVMNYQLGSAFSAGADSFVDLRKRVTLAMLRELSPLGRKLLDNYAAGPGTTITLAVAEMANCAVTINLNRKGFKN